MGAIKYDLTDLDQRFTRLRQVVNNQKAQVGHIEDEVRKCFRSGDLAEIQRLSGEHTRVLNLVEKMEGFVEKWEKQWQEYEHASDWITTL